MVTASDNFNRADGAVGANWSIAFGSAGTVSSNQYAAGGGSMIFWNAVSFANDQYSEIDGASGGFVGGPCVRCATGGNGYYIFGGTNSAGLWKDVGGSFTQVQAAGLGGAGGNASYSDWTGKRVRLEVEGTQIRLLIDGVLINAWYDASLSSGAPGIQSNAGLTDNWAGGDLTPTPNQAPATGLIGRWRADSGVTDAGGGAVSAWQDIGSHTQTLTQSTSGFRPTLTASAINGHPALAFDGTDDRIASSGGWVVSQPFTWVVVVKLIAGGAFSGIMADLSAGNFTQISRSGGVVSSTEGKWSIYAGSAADPVDPATHLNNTWEWATGAFNGASSELFLNGVSVDTGNPGSGGFNGIVFGTFGDASSPFNGQIAEAFVYDHVLDSTERAAMGAYIADRYALSVPSGGDLLPIFASCYRRLRST